MISEKSEDVLAELMTMSDAVSGIVACDWKLVQSHPGSLPKYERRTKPAKPASCVSYRMQNSLTACQRTCQKCCA